MAVVRTRPALAGVFVITAFFLPSVGFADESYGTNEGVSTNAPKFDNELIRGKVVWTADALKHRFGISTVPENAERSLALLTPDGELLPIVENIRGRAFRKDKRLRGKEMELLVRRYEKQPLVQVLRVYLLEDGKRYEVDYWCDVCAIVMFETGPCSCCQDDNRLRKRLSEQDDRMSSVRCAVLIIFAQIATGDEDSNRAIVVSQDDAVLKTKLS